MRDLMQALSGAEKGLESGDLGAAGLEQACADARELYERLIVLRHKAREQALGRAPAPQDVQAAGPEPPETTESPEKGGTPEGPAIRLDTRPPDVSIRQTSLIEAIEQTQQKDEGGTPAPPAQPPAASTSGKEEGGAKPEKRRGEKPATLAEKMEKASITSLGRSISLSHKFWFVSELYNGDRIFYEKTIDRLDHMSELEAARTYVQKEVIAVLKKPADPEAINTFMDLLERRFQQ